MESGFKMEIVLEYSKVFDDEPTLESLLEGISRNTLLQMSTFFLGFSNQRSKYNSIREFIEMYFQAKNNAFANEVFAKIVAYQKSTIAKVIVPFHLTSLILFEYAFQNLDEVETLSEAEIEINFFKAYLLINEQNAIKANSVFASVEKVKKDEPRLSETVFTMAYADSDLINYDLFQILTAQTVKSIMLFEMLEKNQKTQLLLASFLEYYESDNWKEYIKSLLPIVLASERQNNEAYVDILIDENDHKEKTVNFIKKLAIKDSTVLIDYDFTSVRANPIYQVNDTTFRIIYTLFVYEFLHKGLYFKLSEINNSLPKSSKISDFRSFYCEHFSENYLLYETMERMYGNRYKKLSGQDIKMTGVNAEPDYYIRNGNKIFLFESKDVLIGADVKTSFDYEKLDQAIREKFYFVDKGEGKIKNKAILQLINNVENIINKAFPFDNQYKANRVIIYPILVTHHHQYDVVGLNNILKRWFKEELVKLKIKNMNNIKPLTLINIDDLILYQDLFLSNQIQLESLIDSYHAHTTLDTKKKYNSQEDQEEAVKATIIPFATFASQYVGRQKLKAFPKIFMEKGFTIFA